MAIAERMDDARPEPRPQPRPAEPVAGPQIAPVPAAGPAAQDVAAAQQGLGNAATGRMIARATLPPATQQRMGRSFGFDFSGVVAVANSQRAGGGRHAVTEGSEIHFAPGRYAPGTEHGDRLIAHELAHVVQQSGRAPEQQLGRAQELDAERAADAALRGESADVLVGAAHGAQQAYEAYEHQALGDEDGGSEVTVTTASGVRLTYGQMVALCGDFYHSPAALMNAPREELEAILVGMQHERGRVAEGHGRMTQQGAMDQNIEYDRITAQLRERGTRVQHHSHSGDPFGDEHDHEGHDHDEHDEDEGGNAPIQDVPGESPHDRQRRTGTTTGGDPGEFGRGGDYGGESAPDHDVPGVAPGREGPTGNAPVSDTGSEKGFLDLADENSSHFSPENIANNFKPRHMDAMKLGIRAWSARNPGQQPGGIPDDQGNDLSRRATDQGPQPERRADGTVGPAPRDRAAEPGALPSARMGTLPSQGAMGPGVDPTSTRGGPGRTQAMHGDTSAAEGSPERLEGMAMMMSAFSGHFLTDAFAGGHLVSGVVIRKSAPSWFDANTAAVEASLKRHIQNEHPHLPNAAAEFGARKVLGIMGPKAPSIVLKVVHDGFNQSGVQVKNAKGTEWRTVGDNNLASSPETRNQARMSATSARNAVQEAIQTGTVGKPYEALDYVPDVARTGQSDYKPIADFARDPQTFEPLLQQAFVSPGDQFWSLVKAGIPMALYVAAEKPVTQFFGELKDRVVGGARRLWEGAKSVGSSLWGRATDAWGAVRRGVSGAVDTVREGVSGAVDTARGAASRVGSFFGGLLDRGRRAVSGAVDTVRETAGEVGGAISSGVSAAVERVRNAAGMGIDAARNAVSGLFTRARRGAANAIGGVMDFFGSVADRFSGKPDELNVQDTDVQGLEGPTAERPGGAQTYAHGAFMGAAGEMMRDAKWRGIFERLMPQVYAQAARETRPDRLMLMMENNPVMAAYGSVRDQREVRGNQSARPDQQHGGALQMEWDVWLPPDGNVRDLNRVRIAHGNKGTILGERVDPGAGYSREEVQRQSSGSEWLEIFGRAISLGRGDPQAANAADHENVDDKLKNAEGSTPQSIEIAREFLGQNGGLVLDIKSTYSSAEQVRDFVTYLRSLGLNVTTVGTFDFHQLGALDANTRRVKFVHAMAELENYIAANRDNPHSDGAGGRETDHMVERGDTVMFNAGCLLRERDGHWEVDRSEFQRLVGIVDANNPAGRGVNLGLYVQEPAVSPEAVDVITRMVNARPDLFPLGFAHGNISGHADAAVSGSGLGPQGTFDKYHRARRAVRELVE